MTKPQFFFLYSQSFKSNLGVGEKNGKRKGGHDRYRVLVGVGEKKKEGNEKKFLAIKTQKREFIFGK